MLIVDDDPVGEGRVDEVVEVLAMQSRELRGIEAVLDGELPERGAFVVEAQVGEDTVEEVAVVGSRRVRYGPGARGKSGEVGHGHRGPVATAHAQAPASREPRAAPPMIRAGRRAPRSNSSITVVTSIAVARASPSAWRASS